MENELILIIKKRVHFFCKKETFRALKMYIFVFFFFFTNLRL